MSVDKQGLKYTYPVLKHRFEFLTTAHKQEVMFSQSLISEVYSKDKRTEL